MFLRRLSTTRPSISPVLVHRLDAWRSDFERYIKDLSVKPERVSKRNFWLGDACISSDLRCFNALDLMEEISTALVAKVTCQGDSILWDLGRPFDDLPWNDVDYKVEFLDFKTREGARVYWHSSAHILGHAIECHFGHEEVQLSDGPALDPKMNSEGIVGPGAGGFFYDFKLRGRHVNLDDIKPINKLLGQFCKGNRAFQRLELSTESAKYMFMHNPQKLQMIDTLKGQRLSVYKCGDFIDLCRGPHIHSTGILKGGLKMTSSSATNDGEQRVYVISFPEKAMLVDWQNRTEEAKKRDHRVIGKNQDLFMFHAVSPGSAFMLPHGTIVYNRLLTMLRDQYMARGYEEVRTPLIYSSSLWEQSGHLQNYKDNMYQVAPYEHEQDPQEDIMGLKPMNCPGHCVLYAQRNKSFRELPVRLADFSALHRNEASGSLGGMTRLRRFHQDDAHIFCQPSQVHQEVLGCIDFISKVYGELFDFKFKMRLSTRPLEKSIGSNEQWEEAEEALKSVLESTQLPWETDPGEGAFYGPKIDISITDAIGREHQCATVQLDFQMPDRFDLHYIDSDSTKKTPVMIHRAILGSMERFIAILIEHNAGKWPFWLSPRQVAVLPITNTHVAHANSMADKFRKCLTKDDFLSHVGAGGLSVLVDVDTGDTLSKRLRKAQQKRFSVIVVVGDDEVLDGSVSVRSNDATVMKSMGLQEALDCCASSVRNRENRLHPF